MTRQVYGRRLMGALVVLVLLSATIAGSVSAQAQKLVIYSGRSESLVAPLLEQFSKDTGIEVEVRYAGTTELAATLLEEGDNSPADVFFAQDAGALGALGAEDRLLKLPESVLSLVDPKFQSADGLWVGVSGRARVLVYNTQTLNPEDLPASILELTDSKWKGKIGWAPSNASFQSQVTAMRVALGEEATTAWLKGILANEPKVYEGNTAVVKDVAAGVIEVGLVNHYYIWQLHAQEPDAAVDVHFFPKGDIGSLVNVAGAAILKSSKNVEAAEKLIAYLLSEAGQTYFREKTYEYPLVEGIEAVEGLTPLKALETPAFDLSDLADLEGTLELLRETGVLP